MRITEREGLVVYLQHPRDARKLRKYGDCIYQSRKLHYAVLYIDASKRQEIMDKLTQFKFVKKVLPPQLDAIDRDFVGSLTRGATETTEAD